MSKPPLFESVAFREALEQAKAKGGWLIVDATAEWCGPCKMMDRKTWRDEAVGQWVAEKGMAIQVDVDAENDVARTLEVRAMPTVIAFKDGVEQDRVVGFRDPRGLLDWFGALERGETAVDQMARDLADPEHDMQGRLRLADALLEAGRLERATDEYVWLWDNVARVEPEMAGVRLSFMASRIEALVASHPPAGARFAEIRDRTGATADAGGAGPGAVETRREWIALNRILGDDDLTLAWFDGVKRDPQQADAIEQLAVHLLESLQERKRWADIGILYRNPLAQLKQNHTFLSSELPPGLAPEMIEPLREAMIQHFRAASALMFGSLRAAGRAREASELEAEASRLDPSDEMKAALEQALTAYA
jgi:thioredoxin 1